MVENVPPGRVWEALQNDPNAQLVDVRTDVEWQFVGVPDLVGRRQAGGPGLLADVSDDAAQCRLR